MDITGIYTIQTHEQLKAIADPLRTKILMNLVKKEYTGQQLAELLDITRNNIYFHLKELEKHQVIHVVRKEEKNGIVQKYYRAVASRFIPDEHLLPSEDLIETSRQVFMETVEATRSKILKAPAESFALNRSNELLRKNIAAAYALQGDEENFTAFLQDFKDLLHKHFGGLKESPEASGRTKSYYISLIGFQDNDEDITFSK